MAGCCECGNEPSGSINAGNFLSTSSGRTLLHGINLYPFTSGTRELFEWRLL